MSVADEAVVWTAIPVLKIVIEGTALTLLLASVLCPF